MIVFGTLAGIAVLAASFAVSDLVDKRKPRQHVDSHSIDIGEAAGAVRTGASFPPSDEGRPQK